MLFELCPSGLCRPQVYATGMMQDAAVCPPQIVTETLLEDMHSTDQLVYIHQDDSGIKWGHSLQHTVPSSAGAAVVCIEACTVHEAKAMQRQTAELVNIFSLEEVSQVKTQDRSFSLYFSQELEYGSVGYWTMTCTEKVLQYLLVKHPDFVIHMPKILILIGPYGVCLIIFVEYCVVERKQEASAAGQTHFRVRRRLQTSSPLHEQPTSPGRLSSGMGSYRSRCI